MTCCVMVEHSIIFSLVAEFSEWDQTSSHITKVKGDTLNLFWQDESILARNVTYKEMSYYVSL